MARLRAQNGSVKANGLWQLEGQRARGLVDRIHVCCVVCPDFLNSGLTQVPNLDLGIHAYKNVPRFRHLCLHLAFCQDRASSALAPAVGTSKSQCCGPRTWSRMLGGSWVVIRRVISRVTILITHIRGLITPLNYP